MSELSAAVCRATYHLARLRNKQRLGMRIVCNVQNVLWLRYSRAHPYGYNSFIYNLHT